MPTGVVNEIMPAGVSEVFDLIHDYDRRLEWDTLLREAYVEPPDKEAGKGVVTMCRGRWLIGGASLQTVYVSFDRGRVAAVRMTNRPLFFESFAASIRHLDLGKRSTVIYKFNFRARPYWLRFILEPVMLRLMTLETRKRLRSLSEFIAAKSH